MGNKNCYICLIIAGFFFVSNYFQLFWKIPKLHNPNFFSSEERGCTLPLPKFNTCIYGSESEMGLVDYLGRSLTKINERDYTNQRVGSFNIFKQIILVW